MKDSKMSETTSTQTFGELMGDLIMFTDKDFATYSDAMLNVALTGYSDNPKFTLEMNLSAREMAQSYSYVMGHLFRSANNDHAWYATEYNIMPSVNRIIQREFKQKILDTLNLDFFGSDSEAVFAVENDYNVGKSEYETLLKFKFILDTSKFDIQVKDLPVNTVREFFSPVVEMFEEEIHNGVFFRHILDVWTREENSVNTPKEAFLDIYAQNTTQLAK